MYCQICAVDLTINEAIPLCQGSDLYKKIAKCIPIVVSETMQRHMYVCNKCSSEVNISFNLMEKAVQTPRIIRMKLAQYENRDRDTRKQTPGNNMQNSKDCYESDYIRNKNMFVDDIVPNKNVDVSDPIIDDGHNRQFSETIKNEINKPTPQKKSVQNLSEENSVLINGKILQTLLNRKSIILMCDLCQCENFFSELSYWEHLRIKHNYEEAPGGYEILTDSSENVENRDAEEMLITKLKEMTAGYEITCYKCRKYFKNSVEYSKHNCLCGSIHKTIEICYLCNATFSNQKALEFHVKMNHLVRSVGDEDGKNVISIDSDINDTVSMQEDQHATALSTGGIIIRNEKSYDDVHTNGAISTNRKFSNDIERNVSVQVVNSNNVGNNSNADEDIYGLDHLITVVEEAEETELTEERTKDEEEIDVEEIEVEEIFNNREDEHTVQEKYRLYETTDKGTTEQICRLNDDYRTAANNDDDDDDNPVVDQQHDDIIVDVIKPEQQRKFKCEYCHKEFVKKMTLKAHLNVHADVRPYACRYCDKRFRSMANLQQHIRQHTGEKPYSCPICNKRFARRPFVITHMRMHTGEKPYCCHLCGALFTQIGDLRRHEARMHRQVTGNNKYYRRN